MGKTKMERMISENPPELEPHLKHIYRLLIKVEAAGRD